MTFQRADFEAIHDLFLRTIPVNQEAADIKDAWNTWYGHLRAYDIDSSSATYAEAKTRRDAFNRANEKGPDVFLHTPPQKETSVMADAPVLVPKNRPTLRKGIHKTNPSTKAFVIEWQRVIGAEPDGAFGPLTESATKKWQYAHGLTDDGIVGPKTWAKAIELSTAASNEPQSVTEAATRAVREIVETVKAAPTPTTSQQSQASAAEQAATAATSKPPKPKTPKVIPPAVKEAVSQTASMAKAAPVWVRALAATGAVLSGLIFVKWLGSPKRS